MIMNKKDLINELSRRTDFYKKDIEEMVDALPGIFIDLLNTATYEEDSFLFLAPGFSIGGKRIPEREAKDPRNGDLVVSPEKVLPYATFSRAFRNKLRKKKKTKKVR